MPTQLAFMQNASALSFLSFCLPFELQLLPDFFQCMEQMQFSCLWCATPSSLKRPVARGYMSLGRGNLPTSPKAVVQVSRVFLNISGCRQSKNEHESMVFW